MTTNYVIFDCDGGSDDAWALLLLLKAEAEKQLVLLGITICGSGNTTLHNAAYNMLRILKACGRDEIPIFLGASDSLLPPFDKEERPVFHGKDGFGDVLPQDEDIDVHEMVEGEHAVAAIHQFCIENPKQVTVIAVGPLTNIALCYSMYGRDFSENIKELYIMGGNHQGVGNYTRAAEFNFYSDPEAAHIVLSKSKCPITILPWEPCMDDKFFICIKWRLEHFGPMAARENHAVELLNCVEASQYLKPGFKGWNPCDAILVAAFLFKSRLVRKQSLWHCIVDLSGHTRGQMVLDHLQEVDKNPKNVRIIELVEAEFFKSAAEWGAGLREFKLSIFTEEPAIDVGKTEIKTENGNCS
ncbi:nucleoside hydrolase-like [Musca vetustissima]|uniref:nucleoside hydrolase-like n=1 Tax=Musca vetustissima TaxID=27455 RepID=UPI002AB6F8A4|nr:nucleoside hydrolase-like [Musca vetustissima]